MSALYEITHRTTYTYAEPVQFGEHRVLFRPRDSHDQRVLATDLQVSPGSAIRLIQDPHSNSVALVQPLHTAATLEFICTFTIERVQTNDPELPVAPSALQFPFAYTVDERIDLEHYLRPQHDDAEGKLDAWARQFVSTDGPTATRDMLAQMNQHIGSSLSYQVRHEPGTQAPLATLSLGSGTCRDFALLMMEALRWLGVATRFVSGYLYDTALDGSGAGMTGAGATHAWLEAYLPGAGWVSFDPTNNLQGDLQLIRVGVARHPGQAAPVAGSWFGTTGAYVGMTVDVRVQRIFDFEPAPASPDQEATSAAEGAEVAAAEGGTPEPPSPADATSHPAAT